MDYYEKNRDGMIRRAKSNQSGLRDPDLPWPEGWCSYYAAHHRVRAVHGRAREHQCSCGELAVSWSYLHNDPNQFSQEMLDTRKNYVHTCYYSGTPSLEFWEPMCHKCHSRFDGKMAKDRQQPLAM